MSVYADIHYLNRLVGEEFAMTGVQVELSGDQSDLRQLYRELKELPAIEAVNTREQLADRLIDTVLEFQTIAIGFLIGFAGVIFFGSIVNASLVNLAERQREVATLVALGQTHWQVGSVFLRESVVTSLAGAVLGLPLGYLLMLGVAKQVENDTMRFPIVPAPWAFVVTLLLALAFAVIAHGFVQWQINRMDVVEALKVKE
jgi:putative ABC transport system permease protein